MGGATVLRVGYKIMLRTEQVDFFCLSPHIMHMIVTLRDTLVATEVNKNVTNEFVGK